MIFTPIQEIFNQYNKEMQHGVKRAEFFRLRPKPSKIVRLEECMFDIMSCSIKRLNYNRFLHPV